jgi:hypothetical protein
MRVVVVAVAARLRQNAVSESVDARIRRNRKSGEVTVRGERHALLPQRKRRQGCGVTTAAVDSLFCCTPTTRHVERRR